VASPFPRAAPLSTSALWLPVAATKSRNSRKQRFSRPGVEILCPVVCARTSTGVPSKNGQNRLKRLWESYTASRLPRDLLMASCKLGYDLKTTSL